MLDYKPKAEELQKRRLFNKRFVLAEWASCRTGEEIICNLVVLSGLTAHKLSHEDLTAENFSTGAARARFTYCLFHIRKKIKFFNMQGLGIPAGATCKNCIKIQKTNLYNDGMHHGNLYGSGCNEPLDVGTIYSSLIFYSYHHNPPPLSWFYVWGNCFGGFPNASWNYNSTCYLDYSNPIVANAVTDAFNCLNCTTYVASTCPAVCYPPCNLRENSNHSKPISLSPIVFPNPANNFINISNISDGDIIEISSILGVLVKEIRSLGQENQISISNLPPGIYILSINNIVSDKFIKLSN